MQCTATFAPLYAATELEPPAKPQVSPYSVRVFLGSVPEGKVEKFSPLSPVLRLRETERPANTGGLHEEMLLRSKKAIITLLGFTMDLKLSLFLENNIVYEFMLAVLENIIWFLLMISLCNFFQ